MVSRVEVRAVLSAYQAYAPQISALVLLMAVPAQTQTSAQEERARLVLAALLRLVSQVLVHPAPLQTCA